MRKGIVEGEPGIFPDPIARFYRWLLGLLGRHGPHGPHETPDDAAPNRQGDAPST